MAERSTDEIWERLGGMTTEIRNLAGSNRALIDKIDQFEERQADHRRRLYERMDAHDDRIAAVEAGHRELHPRVQRVHDFVDEAELAQAKADGKRELIVQTATIGAKVWQVVRGVVLAAAIAAAAVWRDLVELLAGKPPHL